MKQISLTVSLLAIVAGFSATSAADAPTPAAILEKALKATGGEAKLAKFQGLILKGKGAYHVDGMDLPFTGVWHTQGADKGRTLIEKEAKGGKSYELSVVNGDKGWTKEGKLESQQMDKDELAEEKANLYFNWITSLAPLKGKDFKLTPLDEAKVDGRAAVGFTVVRKGQRNIKLFFDKETGLLAQSERPVKDGNKDVTETVLFSNYKEVDGIKIAMKYSVKWQGQPQADVEMSEAKVAEKLDDKLFTRP
jgi:outer membrane lipoprotein-sorting protein